jgi:hypothetical protein
LRTPIYPDQKHLRPHFAVTCVGSSSLGRSDGPAGGGERAPGGAQLLKRERRKEGRKTAKAAGLDAAAAAGLVTQLTRKEKKKKHMAPLQKLGLLDTHISLFLLGSGKMLVPSGEYATVTKPWVMETVLHKHAWQPCPPPLPQ